MPLRIEIGPKDVAKGIGGASAARPARKEGKSFVAAAGAAPGGSRRSRNPAGTIRPCASFPRRQYSEPADYEEFKSAVENGFAFACWCCTRDCEANIKEETKATMRCIPLEQPARWSASTAANSRRKRPYSLGR